MEEFDDWKLDGAFLVTVVSMSCVAQKTESASSDHNDGELCTDCEVPICNECWSALDNVDTASAEHWRCRTICGLATCRRSFTTLEPLTWSSCALRCATRQCYRSK